MAENAHAMQQRFDHLKESVNFTFLSSLECNFSNIIFIFVKNITLMTTQTDPIREELFEIFAKRDFGEVVNFYESHASFVERRYREWRDDRHHQLDCLFLERNLSELGEMIETIGQTFNVEFDLPPSLSCSEQPFNGCGGRI